jgi:hypothetical protein
MLGMSAVPAPLALAADTSLRALQRRLSELLPNAARESVAGDAPPLEVTSQSADLPRLIDAEVVEGGPMRRIRIEGAPTVGFTAFLDGTQSSRIAWFVDGVPIVHGTVGAVIRERKNRRLTTWRHIVSTRVYAPRALLGADVDAALSALPFEIVDTSATGQSAAPATDHPFALGDAARHFVQRDRERAEHELASEWCKAAPGPLFVDGGIGGIGIIERTAAQASLIGVVKSHRTLYASGAPLQQILRLAVGERSMVFRITSAKRRTTVASWYLRMRDHLGHDPMWGLVRVEIAELRDAAPAAIRERADEVSRWILAESSPIALPDGRWDKMVYGIRDCEEFLRAVV